MKSDNIDISISTSFYNSYKDINLSLEKPFKEFIDNSTQSYYDNKEKLHQLRDFEKLIIKIQISNNQIIILDNAFGMSKEDFDRSLRLGAKKATYSYGSRSQYGVGMKYASMYLGDRVTIESSMYGNDEVYNATLDSDQLEKNVSLIPRYVQTELTSKHFTKITISKLRQNYNQITINNLVRKIGKIYKHDITNNKIEISINDIRVNYEDPVLMCDPETGTEFLEFFEDEVIFEGQNHVIHGWIGFLEKADLEDAGFSLLKNERQIIANYRPSSLLGKGNDYAFQRVTGEINLNDFPVVFNKTDFKWENGLEEEFINVLKRNKKISYIIKVTRDFRKRNKTEIDPKKVKKISKGIENLFSPIKTTVKISMPLDTKLVVEEEDLIDYNPDSTLDLTYEGLDYKFDIIYSSEIENDFFSLKVTNLINNHYRIYINKDYKFFEIITNANDRLNFITHMSILFALTQISSKSAGLKESYKFINKINELLNLIGKL